MTGKQAAKWGYKQVSRKCRRVAKIPRKINPINFIRRHHNQFYQTLVRLAESDALRGGFTSDFIKIKELSEEEFISFRQHGGGVA